MISVKVKDEWCTLDTLNGYYRLDDLWSSVGNPMDKTPRTFALSKMHKMDSIQFTKNKTWGNQVKLYEYCSYIDNVFKQIMHEACTTKDLDLALTIATGVLHKKV